MSTDAAALGDEIDLLVRSLEDARAEHARGELDDEGLAAIERRDGERLTAARAALATLDEQAQDPDRSVARVAPDVATRRPRRLLAVAGTSFAAAIAVIVLAAANPFATAPKTVPVRTTKAKVHALLYVAEVYVTTGQPLRALTSYDAVLRLAPRNPEALVESGWLRYEFAGLGADNRAQTGLGAAEVRRAVHLAPSLAPAHLYDGIVLYQHFHDRTAALAQLVRAGTLPETKAEQWLTATFLRVVTRR